MQCRVGCVVRSRGRKYQGASETRPTRIETAARGETKSETRNRSAQSALVRLQAPGVYRDKKGSVG